MAALNLDNPAANLLFFRIITEGQLRKQSRDFLAG